MCNLLLLCNSLQLEFDYVNDLLFQFYFSMFLHKAETYSLMTQLINLAMKQWVLIIYLFIL